MCECENKNKATLQTVVTLQIISILFLTIDAKKHLPVIMLNEYYSSPAITILSFKSNPSILFVFREDDRMKYLNMNKI